MVLWILLAYHNRVSIIRQSRPLKPPPSLPSTWRAKPLSYPFFFQYTLSRNGGCVNSLSITSTIKVMSIKKNWCQIPYSLITLIREYGICKISYSLIPIITLILVYFHYLYRNYFQNYTDRLIMQGAHGQFLTGTLSTVHVHILNDNKTNTKNNVGLHNYH